MILDDNDMLYVMGVLFYIVSVNLLNIRNTW